MTLDQIDTSKFLADPKDSGFVQKMIDISDVFSFKTYKANHKKFLIFITLMYDKNSYFRKEVKGFNRRKYEAGIAAGFKLNDDKKFAKWVEDIMIGKNAGYNKAVVKYVSVQNNIEYSKLVLYDYAFYKVFMESFDEFDHQGKTKKLIDDLTLSIDNLEKKLLGGEEVENVRAALYEDVSETLKGLRPEDMIERFGENGLKDLNQWGDYDLDQIEVNFVGNELPNQDRQ